jgi:hypothetical protein
MPCSKEPSTGTYPELYESNPKHPILSKIHFNTVHPPTSWSSYIPLLPHSCYMPAHLIRRDLIFLIILREEYKL